MYSNLFILIHHKNANYHLPAFAPAKPPQNVVNKYKHMVITRIIMIPIQILVLNFYPQSCPIILRGFKEKFILFLGSGR